MRGSIEVVVSRQVSVEWIGVLELAYREVYAPVTARGSAVGRITSRLIATGCK